uniref:Uncharacterized protein n=1 Tax=Plectus sambesii TaxID=2011161 RepID=A0A914WCQ1_9BILA
MTVGAAVLLAVIVAVVAASEENNGPLVEPSNASPFVGSNVVSRAKRQTYYYYTCGNYPNQYYSYYPCNTCSNGGTKIGVGCYYASDCTRYYNGVSTCLENCCCTVPGVVATTPAQNAPMYCWAGQTATQTCAGRTCPANQACVNGVCCPQTQAWQYACGGEAATAACVIGNNGVSICGNGYSCTTANYCCECPVGRATRLVNGLCPTGFALNRNNNFCCATCPSGQSPRGICVNGFCSNGYVCTAGNICCQPVG